MGFGEILKTAFVLILTQILSLINQNNILYRTFNGYIRKKKKVSWNMEILKTASVLILRPDLSILIRIIALQIKSKQLHLRKFNGYIGEKKRILVGFGKKF